MKAARLNKARELSPSFYLLFANDQYLTPQAGVRRMSCLWIRCPKTGRAIFTGREVESASFRSSPVFFSHTYCTLCRETHEWFVKDAWVCDPNCSECKAAREQQVA